ncbi:hypothetical protein [Mangrovicoccus sp. HB161399]|uniref:hypothetical protein n=1 Tax=Mangrovicoccus sp. HB161399 TaxID=2720392 RepID=UPI001551F87B|nr:hypothetical protein [Mangrovicoccus sp. HB161399]
MMIRCLTCCLALAWASAAPGGAWPRGKGHAFLSFAYEETVEQGTGKAALGFGGTMPEEEPESFGFSSVYAELGVTGRLTLGIDAGMDHGPDTYQAILFASLSVTPAEWRHQIALEFGMGQRDYPADSNDAANLADLRPGGTERVLRPGLSWGMGFGTPFGNGWTAVDARLELRMTHDDAIPKIDTTIGIAPGKRSLAYLQLQYSDYPDNPPNWRLVPTYVFRPVEWLALESALLWDAEGGDRAGLRAGIWLEF